MAPPGDRPAVTFVIPPFRGHHRWSAHAPSAGKRRQGTTDWDPFQGNAGRFPHARMLARLFQGNPRPAPPDSADSPGFACRVPAGCLQDACRTLQSLQGLEKFLIFGSTDFLKSPLRTSGTHHYRGKGSASNRASTAPPLISHSRSLILPSIRAAFAIAAEAVDSSHFRLVSKSRSSMVTGKR